MSPSYTCPEANNNPVFNKGISKALKTTPFKPRGGHKDPICITGAKLE